jgi:hypothetical protein
MYRVGMVKPVYMTKPRIRIAAGGRASTRVLVRDAMDRKNMDMVRVRMNEANTKKKKGPGSRLR